MHFLLSVLSSRDTKDMLNYYMVMKVTLIPTFRTLKCHTHEFMPEVNKTNEFKIL